MSLSLTIDNGGTFTDACLFDGEKIVSTKTLTTPYDLTKCFVEVINNVSGEFYDTKDIKKLIAELDIIRYSTTAGTNAVVQKQGPRLGLIMRKGQEVSNILESPDEKEMFNILVDNRVKYIDINYDTGDPESELVDSINALLALGSNQIVVSLSEPNLTEDERKIKNLILRRYPRHLLGAVPVLFSSELTDDIDIRRRTWSALINSFLHPSMEQFLYNAENFLRTNRAKNPLLIFQNDGTTSRVAKSIALKSYGSGPHGGMEGSRVLAQHYNLSSLLTMDVGGTTTDIGLIKNEQIDELIYGKVEGIQTSMPIANLRSIGAGGSSIFKVVDGKIQVGPESAGASPGPACFARGGQNATITDAYLLMGILDKDSYFDGDMTLDESRARTAVEKFIAEPLNLSFESALIKMEQAYQEKISEGLTKYGSENTDLTLLGFGGAGPMSACGVALTRGIDKVLIPKSASVFSAFGIGFSDIAHNYQSIIKAVDISEYANNIHDKIKEFEERAKRDMFSEGYDLAECNINMYLSYWENGEHQKFLTDNPAKSVSDIENAEQIIIHYQVVKPIVHYELNDETVVSVPLPDSIRTTRILNNKEQFEDVPVYQADELLPGCRGEGPALIEDKFHSCRVLEGWTFEITSNNDIFILKNEK